MIFKHSFSKLSLGMIRNLNKMPWIQLKTDIQMGQKEL